MTQHHATPWRPAPTDARSEAGEGVISTAIAVLIMALIGGLMWIAFQGVFDSASGRISDQVEQIGN